MNEYRVSIIVPIFNVGEYLERCLISLVNQTEKNIQIILVDDGSTDNSVNICEAFAERDNRILLIQQTNSGVSMARNSGILHAKAEWILFVDGDDWIEEDAVENLLRYSNNDIDVVVGSKFENYVDVEYCYAQNYRPFTIEMSKYRKFVIERTMLSSFTEKKDMPEFVHFIPTLRGPWGKLYKRELITKNSLSFIPGLKRGQDVVFNLYAFQVANRIKCINIPIYHYRIWNGSTVGGTLKNNLSVYNDLLNCISVFVQDSHCTEYMKFMRLYSILLLKEMFTPLILRVKTLKMFFDARKILADYLNSDYCIEALTSICISDFSNFKMRVFCILLRLKLSSIACSLCLLEKIID